WPATELCHPLGLDRFRAKRLPPGRKGVRWAPVLQIFVTHRLFRRRAPAQEQERAGQSTTGHYDGGTS
ncbi:MAG: hypothetical protein D6766_01220, partial [Verrucomicrobia bacterium]